MFFRRQHEEGPEIEIPVTPMLDMAFQLLTFFLFTYHPSAMEGQVELSLPSGGRNIDWGGDPQPFGDAVVLRLRTQHGDEGAGSIVFPIEVEGPLVKGVSDGMEDLEVFLTRLRTDGRIARVVRIEADRRLRWAFVVEVMDACKRSGLTVSFGAPGDR